MKMHWLIGVLVIGVLVTVGCDSLGSGYTPQQITAIQQGTPMAAVLTAFPVTYPPTPVSGVGTGGVSNAAANAQATIDTATRIAGDATRIATDATRISLSATEVSISQTKDATLFQQQVAAANVQLSAEQQMTNLRLTVAAKEAVMTMQALDAQSRIDAADAQSAEEQLYYFAQVQEAEASKAAAQARFWNFFQYLVGFATLVLVGTVLYYLFVWRPQHAVRVVEVNGQQIPFVQTPQGYAPVITKMPTQLPAPSALTPPPDEDTSPIQLPALTSGHVLIAGETGSGKSTAMKAVLGSRQNVIVLDPHDAPGEWGNNTTVIGGGRDFKAIGQFIVQTSHLLNERYQQRASGVTRFDPITVASDELPAIVDALGKDMWSVFRLWLREGRKVSLFVIFSTQSTRVKTLGIEGESDLLENFASAIVLGKVAAAEYPELVQGMAWPAVIRTAQGARAVIIPHEEVAPNAAALREYPNQQGKIEPPAQPFVAPVPQPIVTEKHGTISPMEIMNVLRMKRQGESGRTIEEAVFGTPGGAAYYKVKTILEAYGHMLQTA